MDPLTIMALATGAIRLGEELYQFIQRQRATMQQSGEWTDEQEAAFVALQQQRAAQPWQKPTGS